MNRGHKQTNIIIIDFSKAFDKVPHSSPVIGFLSGMAMERHRNFPSVEGTRRVGPSR